MTDGRFLTTAEASVLLGVQPWVLRETRKAGRITGYDDRTGTALLATEKAHRGDTLLFRLDDIIAHRDAMDEFAPTPDRSRWIGRARCRGMSNEDTNRVFFPPSDPKPDYVEAARLCGVCPVRLQCLQWCVQAGMVGYAGGVRPTHLAKLAVTWRTTGRLPRFCGWCAKAFTPHDGGRHCSDACSAKELAAGGPDHKNTLTATPYRSSVRPEGRAG